MTPTDSLRQSRARLFLALADHAIRVAFYLLDRVAAVLALVLLAFTLSAFYAQRRWLGRRPHVRGTAMNPIDHPHGGGEGRTSGGRHPVSPWGTPTKGAKTRSNKRTDGMIVRRRNKKR